MARSNIGHGAVVEVVQETERSIRRRLIDNEDISQTDVSVEDARLFVRESMTCLRVSDGNSHWEQCIVDIPLMASLKAVTSSLVFRKVVSGRPTSSITKRMWLRSR